MSKGVELAREAEQSIGLIQQNSSKVAEAVNEISLAIREQGVAAREIAQNVERVAQMTEQGSIASQAGAALASMASRFRLCRWTTSASLHWAVGSVSRARPCCITTVSACCVRPDAAALARWHSEFESRAPAAHHAFLLRLGLSEKEATQVRMLTRNIENNTMSMHYFFELFEGLPRQGPGCEAATLRALRLLEHLPANPVVLDIGCGSGLQTLTLARELQTTILAIDNHPPLLRQLDQAARQAGLGVETREMSMIDMPFPPAHFDLLWAEGSIFIIGLARGLQDFRRTLKPGGYLAFTEMCWFEADPPAEIRAYLGRVYPDIRSMASICALAEASAYALVDSFQLPDSAWWNDILHADAP